MLARPSILKMANSPRVSTGGEKASKVSFQAPDNIVTAIEQFVDGSNKQDYALVLRQVMTGEVEDKYLSAWLQQLVEHITVVSPQCEGLLSALMKLNWPSRSKEVVKGYKKFVPMLISAHTSNARLVLVSLIGHFFNEAIVGDDADALAKLDSKVMRKKWDNVHSVLKSIYALVPTMPNLLIPLLASSFPYIKKDACTQASYVKNLLTMTTYLPHMRKRILEIIVDRMIKIDVHCTRQEIECAEDSREDDDTMEMDDVEPSTNSSKGMAHELANKLDVLMEVMLKYLSKETCNDGELNWETTKSLFKDFLVIFEKLILPTYNCLHVQFLIFYLCSVKECLCEVFIDLLWKKFALPSTPPVLRHSCIAYISSLLTRGKFVPISTVAACFDVIILWIHAYVTSQGGESQSFAGQSIHGPFYAACQLIFYVFAFRHKDFWEMPHGPNYLQGLNFDRIINSHLNPLKFCLPVIVKNFASVTRNYQLAYCNTVIERNNRSTLPVIGAEVQASSARCQRSIDTLFPFDPYLLIRSKKYIDPLYQEYNGGFQEETTQEEDSEEFLDKVGDLSTSPMVDICDFFSSITSPSGFKLGSTRLK